MLNSDLIYVKNHDFQVLFSLSDLPQALFFFQEKAILEISSFSSLENAGTSREMLEMVTESLITEQCVRD